MLRSLAVAQQEVEDRLALLDSSFQPQHPAPKVEEGEEEEEEEKEEEEEEENEEGGNKDKRGDFYDPNHEEKHSTPESYQQRPFQDQALISPPSRAPPRPPNDAQNAINSHQTPYSTPFAYVDDDTSLRSDMDHLTPRGLANKLGLGSIHSPGSTPRDIGVIYR